MIGDGANFVEHVRDRYGKVLGMTKENQKRRTTENMSKINEERRKLTDGFTLGEKIEKHLEKVKKKEVISHIDDAFYKNEIEQGSLFYVRRTNLQRGGGRTLDVVDEIEIAIQKQMELDEAEKKRDMKFEEFKNKFEDHIEGRAANDRTLMGSADGDDEPPSREF